MDHLTIEPTSRGQTSVTGMRMCSSFIPTTKARHGRNRLLSMTFQHLAKDPMRPTATLPLIKTASLGSLGTIAVESDPRQTADGSGLLRHLTAANRLRTALSCPALHREPTRRTRL